MKDYSSSSPSRKRRELLRWRGLGGGRHDGYCYVRPAQQDNRGPDPQPFNLSLAVALIEHQVCQINCHQLGNIAILAYHIGGDLPYRSFRFHHTFSPVPSTRCHPTPVLLVNLRVYSTRVFRI